MGRPSTFTVDHLRQHALSKGGVLLSTEYFSGKTKYRWSCSLEHVWEATWYDVRKGAWCHECAARDSIKRIVSFSGSRKGKSDFSLVDLHVYATGRSGRCLSSAYTGGRAYYEWECSRGHQWSAQWYEIKNGCWCPECCVDSTRHTSEWLESLVDARDGSWVDGVYLNNKSRVKCRCNKGHEWMTKPNQVQQGQWCPSCANGGPSKPQLEIFEYVKSLVPGEEVLLSDRTAIGPLELDIYVPSRRFGFEYDGLLYHSSCFSSDDRPYNPKRHQKKALACRGAGVKFFAVFGDEWESKPDLIKAMIRWRLGVFAGHKLNARDLELKRLSKNSEYKEFFGRNHIDGHANASFAYGLFLGAKLVLCVSVRRNHAGELELARLATDYDFSVRGGVSRLLAAVKQEVQCPIVSYSNNRLSSGGVYEKLGFIKLAENAPSYYYTDGKVRIWRYRCKRINDPEILAKYPTEKAQALGGVFSGMYLGHSRPLYQIHDYGHQKFRLG